MTGNGIIYILYIVSVLLGVWSLLLLKFTDYTCMHCVKSLTDISVCVWNVNGLCCKSRNYCKFSDASFIKQIQGHDIIGLIETQSSPETVITLKGYSTVRVDRPKGKRAVRHFGGWALLIKNEIRKGIKFEKQTTDFVWLRMSKTFFGLGDDIYLCLAYIPPSSSQYLLTKSDNILDEIRKTIEDFSRLGQVVLTGDLNARIGKI